MKVGNSPAMDAFFARHLKHDDPTVSFEQMKVLEYGGSGPYKAMAVCEKSLTDFVAYRLVNMDNAVARNKAGFSESVDLNSFIFSLSSPTYSRKVPTGRLVEEQER